VLPDGSSVSQRLYPLTEEAEPISRERKRTDHWFQPAGSPWTDLDEATSRDWLDSVDRAAAASEEPAMPEPPSLRLVLNERDLEVLRLLAGGESTADIARELAYSESMIKHVIHGVVGRIGARNRAHAVAIAIRAGVI